MVTVSILSLLVMVSMVVKYVFSSIVLYCEPEFRLIYIAVHTLNQDNTFVLDFI